MDKKHRESLELQAETLAARLRTDSDSGFFNENNVRVKQYAYQDNGITIQRAEIFTRDSILDEFSATWKTKITSKGKLVYESDCLTVVTYVTGPWEKTLAKVYKQRTKK